MRPNLLGLFACTLFTCARPAPATAAPTTAPAEALGDLSLDGGVLPSQVVIQTSGYTTAIAVDPSGKLIATDGLWGLSLYSTQQRALLTPAGSHASDPTAGLAFVGGGRWLQLAGSLKTVFVDASLAQPPLVFEDWSSLTLGRRVTRGAGLRYVNGEREVVRVRLEGTPAQLQVEQRWPVPEDCRRVEVNDDASTGVVLCGSAVLVVDLQQGALRPLPHAPVDPGQARVSADGRWALRFDEYEALSWVNLLTGAETPITLTSKDGAKARSPRVLGVYGRDPVAMVLAGGEVFGVDPVKGVLWQFAAGQASAAAFDEEHGLIVLAAGGLFLFTTKGEPVGRLANRVVRLDSLVLDPASRKLFATATKSLMVRELLEVDLAEAEFRRAATEGPPPAALLQVAGIGGELFLQDARDLDQRISAEGLAPGVLKWGARVSATRAIVTSATRLGLLDLTTRKLERWLPRAAAPLPVFASMAPLTGELVLLDADGTLEAWDPGQARLISRRATPWKRVNPYDLGPVHQLAQVSGGLLLATNTGLSRLDLKQKGGPVELLKTPVPITQVVVSNNPPRLVLATVDTVAVCPLTEAPFSLEVCKLFAGSNPVFVDGGARIAFINFEGGITLLDAASQPVVRGYLGAEDASFFVTQEGLYKASPNGLDLAVLARGPVARLLQDVDVERNSPGRVLEKIGLATAERIEAFRALEARRRERDGIRVSDSRAGEPSLALTEVPPSYADSNSLKLKVKVREGDHPPLRLVVRVNGVPIGGSQGRALPAATREAVADVPVGPGENRVLVTVVDAQGHEAFGESFIVAGTAKRALGQIYFLGVGVSHYADTARDLTYAAKDVRDVAAALKQLAGDRFHPKLLLDGDANHQDVIGARAFLAQAGFEDFVIVYMAGHGLLDSQGRYYFGTRDIDFADPQKGGLSYVELEQLVDGLGAGAKVVFVDSCHAGADERGQWSELDAGVVRARGLANGARPKGPALEGLSQVFADLRRGTGATVIAAAGQEEFAFEDGHISNGLFTHAVLESLSEGRGARENGELWMEDLLRVVRDRVAVLSAHRQLPNVRAGNVGFRQPLFHSPPLTLVAKAWGKEVQAFSLSADRSRLALFAENAVRVLDLPAGTEAFSIALPPGVGSHGYCWPACGAFFTANKNELYVAGGASAQLLDVKAQRWTRVGTEAEQVGMVGQSKNGRWLLTVVKRDSLALLDTSDPARALTVLELRFPVAWAGDRLVSHDGDTLTSTDPVTGERTTQLLELPHEEGAFYHSSFSSDGQVLEVQRVYGSGDLVAIDVRTGKRIRAAQATGVVLTPTGPIVMVDTGMTPFGENPVPVAGPDGAQVGVWPMNGSAAIAAAKGQLLFANGLALLVVPHDPASFLGKELDRAGSLFRKYDAKTGASAGFFGLPIRSPALVAGAGRDVYVIDTRSGEVSSFTP